MSIDRQNHLVIESISLMRLLEDANKLSIEEDWRVVPGSVQVLNILHHELRADTGRVEMYERRYVLTMERAEEEVQVVERADFDWYQTVGGSGYTAVKNTLLQAMLTSVISAWPDWRSWPAGAPGREKMERQEEVYKALLRFVTPRAEEPMPDCYDFTLDDFSFDQARDRGKV